MKTRIRRSELSTPASNERMIAAAARSDADLVFLDLEDAVVPSEKDSAREAAINGLNELEWGSRIRAVRVNSADTQWAHADVIEVVTRAHANLDILILPKVRGPRDVWFFETLIEQLETTLAIEPRIGFEVLIEEAEALSQVEAIAASSPRLEALILGFGDLAASLGVRFGHVADPAEAYPGDPWHHARARIIAAARANGLDPIDGPYPNFHDPEGYRREAVWASTLGMVGKWAIHPSQIPPANDVFAPTEQEVHIARQMCETYEATAGRGDGASSTGGFLVDAASVRIFEAILARAELIAGR